MNDPTKIYDDKLYTFPEDKTKENTNSSGNRWVNRWISRWQQEETTSLDELNKPLPKMTYQQFTKKFQNQIEDIRTSILAHGNYYKAVIEVVRQKYGVKYEGGVAKSSEEALIKIYNTDTDKGKGKEYTEIADFIAKELNTEGSDWHTNLIIPYKESLIKKQEQQNKERREEVAQQWKDKRIEEAQNKLTLDNYPNQSSQIISQNAEILSYKAFVSKYKDAIEGRAKSLEKKKEYFGETATLVATMRIAQLVYGVQLKEIRSKDNSKVQGYEYGRYTQLTQKIQKQHPNSIDYQEASQKMKNVGEVMQIFFNTGYCIDSQYENVLDTTWWEKAKQFKDLRESKMDALRAIAQDKRVRQKYQEGLNELARKKQLEELNKLRHSKVREAMADLGLCLLGLGITLASGGVGALIGSPLVLLLEADEIIGASRVLLTSHNELEPEKEYKIIKGQFVEWGGKAGDDAYEKIAFFLDGKNILSGYLQKNPSKSTISGMSLINLLEEAQDRKDKFDFIVDIKNKISGEDEKDNK